MNRGVLAFLQNRLRHSLSWTRKSVRFISSDNRSKMAEPRLCDCGSDVCKQAYEHRLAVYKERNNRREVTPVDYFVVAAKTASQMAGRQRPQFYLGRDGAYIYLASRVAGGGRRHYRVITRSHPKIPTTWAHKPVWIDTGFAGSIPKAFGAEYNEMVLLSSDIVSGNCRRCWLRRNYHKAQLSGVDLERYDSPCVCCIPVDIKMHRDQVLKLEHECPLPQRAFVSRVPYDMKKRQYRSPIVGESPAAQLYRYGAEEPGGQQERPDSEIALCWSIMQSVVIALAFRSSKARNARRKLRNRA